MGGKSSTSTSQVKIPSEVLARYNAVNRYAEDVASQPFQQYATDPNAFVAPLTQTQQAGIQNVNMTQGMYAPYYQGATQSLLAAGQAAMPAYEAASQNVNAGLAGAQPYQALATGYGIAGARGVSPTELGGQQIQQYMSPYLQNVVGSTLANLQQQQQQEQSSLLGQQIGAGAFGGDRGRLARANLARQQNLATGQVLSGLLNQGYGQALGTAQQQQQIGLGAEQANRAAQAAAAGQMAAIGQQGFGQQLAAAQQQQALGQGLYGIGAGVSQGLAGLGAGVQQAGLTGAQAQLQAGAAQQQTQQAALSALYNQYLQQQGYPFQVAQFLGNIAMGTGALSGSGTTQTQPSSFFSDERLKDNIQPIGETYDGQKIVKFNYKGNPQKQIGLVAQDVETKHPEAVGLAGGFKTVDYDAATKDAASMGGGVLPHHAGEGFARGGSAESDALAEIEKLLGAPDEVVPYGAYGLYGSRGQSSGPYKTTLIEIGRRSSPVAPTKVDIKPLNWAANLPADVEQYAQGGVVPSGYADGGTPDYLGQMSRMYSDAPWSKGGSLNIPHDIKQYELVRPEKLPSESSSEQTMRDANSAMATGKNIADLWKMTPWSNANGGRVGYADGGFPAVTYTTPTGTFGATPAGEAALRAAAEERRRLQEELLRSDSLARMRAEGAADLGGAGREARALSPAELAAGTAVTYTTPSGTFAATSEGETALRAAAEERRRLQEELLRSDSLARMRAEGAADLGGAGREARALSPAELARSTANVSYTTAPKNGPTGVAPYTPERAKSINAPYQFDTEGMKERFGQLKSALDFIPSLMRRRYLERKLGTAAAATGVPYIPPPAEKPPVPGLVPGAPSAASPTALPPAPEPGVAAAVPAPSPAPQAPAAAASPTDAAAQPAGVVPETFAPQLTEAGGLGEFSPSVPADSATPAASTTTTSTAASPATGAASTGVAAGTQGGVPGWMARNEQWLIPLVAGLGTMASSPSRYAGSAFLQGLGGAGSAYETMRSKVAERERTQMETAAQKAEIAQSAIGVTPGTNIPYARVFDENGNVQIIRMPAANEWGKYRFAPFTNEEDRKLAGAQAMQQFGGVTAAPVAQAAAPTAAGATLAAITPTTDNPVGVLPESTRALLAQNVRALDAGLVSKSVETSPFDSAAADADAALNSRTLLNRLTGALSNSPTGPAQDALAQVAQYVNSATGIFGIPPIKPEVLANKEEVEKLRAQLIGQVPRGSQTAQELEAILSSIPGNTTSPAGRAKIVSGILTVNQKAIDQNNYFNNVQNSLTDPNGTYRLSATQAAAAGRGLNQEFNRLYAPKYEEEKDLLEKLFTVSGSKSNKASTLSFIVSDPASFAQGSRNRDLLQQQIKAMGYKDPQMADRILRYFGV